MQSYRTAPMIHTRRPTALILLAGIVGFSSTAHASENRHAAVRLSLDAGGDTFLTPRRERSALPLSRRRVSSRGDRRRAEALAESGADGHAHGTPSPPPHSPGHQWFFFDWGVVAPMPASRHERDAVSQGRHATPCRPASACACRARSGHVRPLRRCFRRPAVSGIGPGQPLGAPRHGAIASGRPISAKRRRSTPTRPATRSGASACTGRLRPRPVQPPRVGGPSGRGRAGPGLVPNVTLSVWSPL